MSDEQTLRLKAREAMAAGRLPQRRPKRMWGGPGIDAPCAICFEPVKRDELGFELEFAPDHEDTGEGDCHVHLRCFAAWEFERRHQENGPRAKAANDGIGPANLVDHERQPGRILPAASNSGTICASDESFASACERNNRHQRGPAG